MEPTQTLIYLVRHAEPLMPDDSWRFIGARSDPPLSRAGIMQAGQLAERFRHVGIGRVWSSGLLRSYQTAEIASGLPSAHVHIEPRLREVDLGLWDGLTAAEINERFPREYEERQTDLIGYRFPGGETFGELQERAVPAFTELAEAALTRDHGEAHGCDVLVVAHKSVNRVILCHFLGLPLHDMFGIDQDYCAVNVLRAALDARGRVRVRVAELTS